VRECRECSQAECICDLDAGYEFKRSDRAWLVEWITVEHARWFDGTVTRGEWYGTADVANARADFLRADRRVMSACVRRVSGFARVPGGS
jgi:hypothetical protein